MNKFEKFHTGMNHLIAAYGFEKLSIESIPIPSSFPNGSPDHSSNAYILVNVHSKEPYLLENLEKEMNELGWYKEQEGQYWVYRN